MTEEMIRCTNVRIMLYILLRCISSETCPPTYHSPKASFYITPLPPKISPRAVGRFPNREKSLQRESTIQYPTAHFPTTLEDK